jgi:hypothetical protein
MSKLDDIEGGDLGGFAISVLILMVVLVLALAVYFLLA